MERVGSSPARVVLLANPDSGSGEAGAAERTLRELGARLTVLGPGDTTAALAAGPERILVAGGDGSLAPVAAAAGHAGVPFGVIPVGTANDFARAMGIPADVEEACAVALGDGRRRIDVAWMGERPFLNAASAGLSPAAARRAGGLKGALGPLAYALGAVQAAATAKPVRLSVACDEEPLFDGEAWQVTVGATGAFGAGSSVGAEPGDGQLDTVVIKARGRVRLARHAWALRRGTAGEEPGALKRRCGSVELRFPGRHNFNVDGELVEAGSCRFRVEPGAVEVIVP